jgi:hypothetical protein
MLGFLLAVALLGGCSRRDAPAPAPVGDEERRTGPPTAHWDMVADLREDQATARHPSDGGGRAWLVEEESQLPARVGAPGHWTLLFEVGPLGIAEGGMVALQVSPFWGWSTPQVEEPAGLGFTTVEPLAEPRGGLALEVATWGEGLLGIRVQGRALASGERLRVRYGAGPQGALADRFAERRSPFWFLVDGDGDGVRGVVPDPPVVDVLPGPPAALLLHLPSTLRPGEAGRLVLAAVDAGGNGWPALEGEVRLTVSPPGLDLPAHLELGAGACAAVPFTAGGEGLFRVEARGPDGLVGVSNPLLVSLAVPRVLWGDPHGHSGLSDGTGTPEDYYAYARDVAGLDFAALTDHDHWGMRFLDRSPDLWQESLAAARAADEPGRFTALPGFEWTSWIHGHRHVLYFEDGGEVLSSLDPRYEHPEQLWAALADRPALSIPHHPGGGPIAVDWSAEGPIGVEPVVEVASVHGVSEAADSPGRIYSPVAGCFARDVLARGRRLGFAGGGDTHDGHPGLGEWSAGQGGLTAVIGAENDRASLLAALRARRVYATNGARILLLARLDGHPLGADLPAVPSATLSFLVVGSAPLEEVQLIRGEEIIERVAGAGEALLQADLALRDLQVGEQVYLRVLQADGGMAWSSPFRVTAGPVSERAPVEATP